MKPENLENLLYFYIEEKKGYDDIDSPVAEESNLAAAYDEILPTVIPRQFSGGGYGTLAPEPPHSPNPVILQYGTLTALQRAQAAAAGRKLAEITQEFSTNEPNRSGIKFKSSCIFVTPEQQTIDIHIIRTPGCEDIPLKILWKTCDRTAQSGIHYIGSTGKINLDKGVTETVIQIEILSSEMTHNDLRFQVDLSVENIVYVPKPITVNIQNMNNLYEDERAIIRNLLQSSASTVSEVIFFLEDKWTLRTFHSGLSYLCSKADSLPLEIGLALDLTMESLKRLRYQEVFKVLNDFFRKDEYEF